MVEKRKKKKEINQIIDVDVPEDKETENWKNASSSQKRKTMKNKKLRITSIIKTHLILYQKRFNQDYLRS